MLCVMPLSSAVRLSHVEFDLVWERLRLGEVPYPLAVPSAGFTVEERDGLRGEVARGLRDRGLADHRDLESGFEDVLVLLARNEISIDGEVFAGGRHAILAAARGGRGVVAVLDAGELLLQPVRSTELTAAVISLLPTVPAAHGGEVTMPRAVFRSAMAAVQRAGYAAFESELAMAGVSGRDLRTVSTLVESGRTGGGQLAANSLDRMGRRTRSPVLNWFDTPAGRYLVEVTRTVQGEEWVTIGPADAARVGRRLTDLVAGLRS